MTEILNRPESTIPVQPEVADISLNGLEEQIAETLQTQVSRRGFNKGILYASIATALASLSEAEAESSNEHYGTNHGVQVEALEPSLKPRAGGEGWFVVPGLGGVNGHSEALELRHSNATPATTPISFINYGKYNFDFSDIEKQMQKQAQVAKLGSMSIEAISMGLVTSLAVARSLELPINRIVAYCSPFNVDDGRDAAGVKLIGELYDEPFPFRYRGGPLGKFVTSFMREFSDQGGIEHIASEWRAATHDVTTGASGQQEASQMALFSKTVQKMHPMNLRFFQQEYKERGIITRDTEVLLVMPEDLTTDHTVHNMQAVENWQDWFEPLGVIPQIRRNPIPGHARTNSPLTTPWIQRTYLAA